MYTITEIEDAIIDYLKTSGMASYCKKIDSYQIEGGDLEEQIRIFALQVPCILIIFSEGTINPFPGKRVEFNMKFQFLVASESLRGRGEARRGTIGTYQIIYDLIFGTGALTGQRLNLEIDPLMPTRVTSEIQTKGFSAYSVEFATKCGHSF